jgi:hypothetical protein
MRRAVIASFLALTLAVGGCGGGSSPAASTTSTSASASGEKSIEEFGREAQGPDREALIGAFHAYLGGIVARDYSTACSYLAASVRRSLQQFASARSEHRRCASLLSALLAPSAATVARQQDEGRITKVRLKGDRAFIVFHSPGAKLYMLTLAREGGGWKTTTVGASVLVPSAVTLGE